MRDPTSPTPPRAERLRRFRRDPRNGTATASVIRLARLAPDAAPPENERRSYLLELLGVTVAELALESGDRQLADEVAAVCVGSMRGRWRGYKSELLFYLHLAGARCDTDIAPSEPFATAIEGDLAAAAAAFDAMGRRHEAAICRSAVAGRRPS